jgi:hypothetical protein
MHGDATVAEAMTQHLRAYLPVQETDRALVTLVAFGGPLEARVWHHRRYFWYVCTLLPRHSDQFARELRSIRDGRVIVFPPLRLRFGFRCRDLRLRPECCLRGLVLLLTVGSLHRLRAVGGLNVRHCQTLKLNLRKFTEQRRLRTCNAFRLFCFPSTRDGQRHDASIGPPTPHSFRQAVRSGQRG